jgi:hypothetical protein
VIKALVSRHYTYAGVINIVMYTSSQRGESNQPLSRSILDPKTTAVRCVDFICDWCAVEEKLHIVTQATAESTYIAADTSLLYSDPFKAS